MAACHSPKSSLPVVPGESEPGHAGLCEKMKIRGVQTLQQATCVPCTRIFLSKKERICGSFSGKNDKRRGKNQKSGKTDRNSPCILIFFPKTGKRFQQQPLRNKSGQSGELFRLLRPYQSVGYRHEKTKNYPLTGTSEPGRIHGQGFRKKRRQGKT